MQRYRLLAPLCFLILLYFSPPHSFPQFCLDLWHKYSNIRDPNDWASGSWFSKSSLIASQFKWVGKTVAKSMMHLPSGLSKEATRLHKCILGYCGDKTIQYPEMLAQNILKKGVDQSELVDEIYILILKQMTDNPKKESERRLWQLVCLAVGTFPPSDDFESYLLNFVLKKRELPGEVGGYAKYCLRRLEGIVKTGASGFVPSVEEIMAYSERPPILATIELVDGAVLAENLPVTPDLSVEKVCDVSVVEKEESTSTRKRSLD